MILCLIVCGKIIWFTCNSEVGRILCVYSPSELCIKEEKEIL